MPQSPRLEPPSTTRICIKCCVEKPLPHFRSQRKPSQFNANCIECIDIARRSRARSQRALDTIRSSVRNETPFPSGVILGTPIYSLPAPQPPSTTSQFTPSLAPPFRLNAIRSSVRHETLFPSGVILGTPIHSLKEDHMFTQVGDDAVDNEVEVSLPDVEGSRRVRVYRTPRAWTSTQTAQGTPTSRALTSAFWSRESGAKMKNKGPSSSSQVANQTPQKRNLHEYDTAPVLKTSVSKSQTGKTTMATRPAGSRTVTSRKATYTARRISKSAPAKVALSEEFVYDSDGSDDGDATVPRRRSGEVPASPESLTQVGRFIQPNRSGDQQSLLLQLVAESASQEQEGAIDGNNNRSDDVESVDLSAGPSTMSNGGDDRTKIPTAEIDDVASFFGDDREIDSTDMSWASAEAPSSAKSMVRPKATPKSTATPRLVLQSRASAAARSAAKKAPTPFSVANRRRPLRAVYDGIEDANGEQSSPAPSLPKLNVNDATAVGEELEDEAEYHAVSGLRADSDWSSEMDDVPARLPDRVASSLGLKGREKKIRVAASVPSPGGGSGGRSSQWLPAIRSRKDVNVGTSSEEERRQMDLESDDDDNMSDIPARLSASRWA